MKAHDVASDYFRLNTWKVYSSPLGAYMRRYIARCPRGTLRLHNIRTSDEGRDMHDHPFDFTSLVLVGGYLEHRPGCHCTIPLSSATPVMSTPHPDGPCRFYGPGSIVRRAATDLHRLELPPGRTAWTVVVTGPYFRKWGFQTAAGWTPFDDYERRFYPA